MIRWQAHHGLCSLLELWNDRKVRRQCTGTHKGSLVVCIVASHKQPSKACMPCRAALVVHLLLELCTPRDLLQGLLETYARCTMLMSRYGTRRHQGQCIDYWDALNTREGGTNIQGCQGCKTCLKTVPGALHFVARERQSYTMRHAERHVPPPLCFPTPKRLIC